MLIWKFQVRDKSGWADKPNRYVYVFADSYESARTRLLEVYKSKHWTRVCLSYHDIEHGKIINGESF